jgi:hypothetical protein
MGSVLLLQTFSFVILACASLTPAIKTALSKDRKMEKRREELLIT